MKRKLLSLVTLLCVFANIQAAALGVFDNVGFTNKAAELLDLINQCKTLGIAVDYEVLNYSTITRFIPYLQQDASNGNVPAGNVTYNTQCMESLYSTTKTKLQGYLNGTLSPMGPFYRGGNGRRIISGNTFVDALGQPVQSVGYGHFTQTANDTHLFYDLGVDNIQTSISPDSVAWQTDAKLWTTYKEGGCDADILTTNTQYKSGANSLKIVNRSPRGDGGVYVRISQEVQVKPNTIYRFGLSAKADVAASLSYFVTWNDVKPASATSAWTNFPTAGFSTYMTTPGQTTMEFFILCTDATTGVYIDDVFLNDLNYPSINLLKNPGFEEAGNWRFDTFGWGYAPMRAALDKAAQNGVGVDLLISPHGFPTWMKTSELSMGSSTYPANPNYVINDPKAQQFIKDYLDFLIPLIKDHPALQSICLSNEPNYYTQDKATFYDQRFRDWLMVRHGSLSAMATAHNKSYSSLSSITIPESAGNIDVSNYKSGANGALYYDWLEYNEDELALWHKMMYDKIKLLAPNIPLHSKMQDYIFVGNAYASNNKLVSGTDVEKFSLASDLAGNDATMYINAAGATPRGLMLWYDFLSSLTGKPIYNSEDHIIPDADLVNKSPSGYDNSYVARQAQNIRHSLFQGAIHGRNASSMWLWDRGNYSSADDWRGNIGYRVDGIAAAGKAALDLKRLAKEVDAFQKRPRDIGIFYSKPSRYFRVSSGGGNAFDTSMVATYNAAIATGHRVGFVTEYDTSKLSNYKVVILAGVTHMSDEAATAIWNYIQGGGKVIRYDSSNINNLLAYTQYDKAQSQALRANIKSNTYTHPISSMTSAALMGYLESDPWIAPKVVAKEGANYASDIDFQYVTYNGKTYVNICNVTASQKTITLTLKDATYIGAKDLISGQIFSGAITAMPYEPMLLELGQPPAAVTNAAITVSNNGIILSWEKPAGDPVNVYLVGTSPPLTLLGTTNDKLFIHQVADLSKPYSYVLRSVNFNGVESTDVTKSVTDAYVLSIDEFNVSISGKSIAYDIKFTNKSAMNSPYVVMIFAQDGGVFKPVSYVHMQASKRTDKTDEFSGSMKLPYTPQAVKAVVFDQLGGRAISEAVLGSSQ